MCNFISIRKSPLFAPDPESSAASGDAARQSPATENGEFSATSTKPQADLLNLDTELNTPPVDPALDVPPAAISEAALRAKQLREAASQRWHAAGERAKEMNLAARNRICENPTKAVFGALGVGLLMGLVMKRASA